MELVVSATQAVTLWEELTAKGAQPCGLAARDTLRLEAAMPLYGHELNEEIDPFQAGLSWTVKMDKGDFLGREALVRAARMPHSDNASDWCWKANVSLGEGAMVCKEGREVGRITSGTLSPTLNQVIAMAYVDSALTTVGTTCEVDIRGQKLPARVVSLPFYHRANS